MASGQEAASSCSPLARSPLAVAPAKLCRGGARRSFSCARFVELPAREWKLALGSGSWVGGTEVETFDELCFEKIYVLKSLNPKP